VDDSLYKDGITADKSIEDLRRLADQEKPFFFAVGFVRPHLPFNAPKKYWDLYSREEIELPENLRYTPKNAPDASIHNFGELRAYIDVPKKGQLSDKMAKSLIHGYYACVSYTDAHVGRLLDELEKLGIEDETIVVLWGDHGWNLGEHALWCKHCVYETSMQAPLIIRAPGMPENNRVASLVEFIDIYPTLCELAELPLPEHLQGRSLVPLLKDSGAVWKDAAVGRYGIGETIRTDRYRYSEFLDKQGDLIGRMLYDHREDPRENVNIVDRPEHEKLVKYLAEQLDARKGK
jgi:arylsulfatase A-like enzyme